MASLTDLKKLRNTTGCFKNNAHQQRGVATVNKGGGGREGGKGGYRERVDDAGDEPDGAAAGDEETDDVPRLKSPFLL